MARLYGLRGSATPHPATLCSRRRSMAGLLPRLHVLGWAGRHHKPLRCRGSRPSRQHRPPRRRRPPYRPCPLRWCRWPHPRAPMTIDNARLATYQVWRSTAATHSRCKLPGRGWSQAWTVDGEAVEGRLRPRRGVFTRSPCPFLLPYSTSPYVPAALEVACRRRSRKDRRRRCGRLRARPAHRPRRPLCDPLRSAAATYRSCTNRTFRRIPHPRGVGDPPLP